LFSGDYGFNIIVENEKGKTFTYEFTNQDFFGNPWSFSLSSKQAKTFSVFEVGKIKTIKVSIFQKGDFLKKVLDNDDSNTLTDITLSGDNIFFTEISCGLGYNLSGIVDNSVKLFTSSSDNFKHYDSTTESNEKTIGLLWCNKSENNNFIGFNDGVRKIK
jgi:hypothetical protein